jgi:hypothetical protein
MQPRLLRRSLILLGGACLGVAVWWSVDGSAPHAHAPAATPSSTSARAAGVTPITASVGPSPPSTGPSLDPESLLRELEPLAVTDRPRALALALEADAKLPTAGAFAEARRALIVTLLVDLQRMAEARDRTRAFMQSYPDSRYLPLVQGVTGVHPRPRPRELRDARR